MIRQINKNIMTNNLFNLVNTKLIGFRFRFQKANYNLKNKTNQNDSKKLKITFGMYQPL